MTRRLRIAIAGTRGVPPRYGGFETFAAELGTRLVERGHEVTVYCRGNAGFEPAAPASSRHGAPHVWRGIECITLPALGGKYLETVSHTFLSALDSLRRDFDVVLLCNAANAFTIPIFALRRRPVAINVDGIERRRRKWNVLGRAVYATGEAFSVSFASRVIADAEVIAGYYRANYGAEPVVIPYGSDFPSEDDSDVLERLGLTRRNYILYVSRFEPENNPLEVVRAYEKLGESVPPLVMVGRGLYARDLVAELQRHASSQILFPGALYGRDYRTLQRNALLYIQATEVGGTHPALIEAMGSGGLVLALDTPENREVGGEAIRYFRLRPDETLSAMVMEVLGDERTEEWREKGRKRAGERYGWEGVTEAYERLFWQLVSY